MNPSDGTFFFGHSFSFLEGFLACSSRRRGLENGTAREYARNHLVFLEDGYIFRASVLQLSIE